jgi:hypothetical protein
VRWRREDRQRADDRPDLPAEEWLREFRPIRPDALTSADRDAARPAAQQAAPRERDRPAEPAGYGGGDPGRGGPVRGGQDGGSPGRPQQDGSWRNPGGRVVPPGRPETSGRPALPDSPGRAAQPGDGGYRPHRNADDYLAGRVLPPRGYQDGGEPYWQSRDGRGGSYPDRPRPDESDRPHTGNGLERSGRNGYAHRPDEYGSALDEGAGPRRGNGYPPRREEGYRARRDDGYPPRPDDGYPPRRDDGYPPRREEGFPPRREEGFPARRDDGYPGRRDDGYPPRREDGYPGRRDDGYPPRREDGYPGRRAADYPPQPDRTYTSSPDGRFAPRPTGSQPGNDGYRERAAYDRVADDRVADDRSVSGRGVLDRGADDRSVSGRGAYGHAAPSPQRPGTDGLRLPGPGLEYRAAGFERPAEGGADLVPVRNQVARRAEYQPPDRDDDTLTRPLPVILPGATSLPRPAPVEAPRGPFEPARPSQSPVRPISVTGSVEPPPTDYPRPVPPPPRPLPDAAAVKLDQIKDLYLTAEAIGENALDKHFDQVSDRQRELIREFFERSEPGGTGAGGPQA